MRNKKSSFGFLNKCKSCLNAHNRLHRIAAPRKTLTKQQKINARIASRLRSRLSSLIKHSVKIGSAVRDLGCSVAFLRQHLESKFQPGMTWNNYGLRGWHIDHIQPLCKFDLTDREQFLKAVHYTNLQPLWAVDNWKKNRWNH